MTDTRVIADEGIYDPGQDNDRFLLGCKGTMSAAALHWLRSRLLGGTLEKAQHGTLRFRPPAGFGCDPAGQVVCDPDEEVQEAVRLLFALCAQSGSALAVVTHCAVPHLRFPTRGWGKRQGNDVCWGPLTHTRVLEVLHHPAYAGTYVSGRTQTRTRVLPGEAPRVKGRTRLVARQDWPIVLPDQHPASRTWAQCLRHQPQLDDHRTFRPEDRPGAVREGAALRQGLVLCGQCGRRMRVRSLEDGTTPSDDCHTLHVRQAGPTWQSLRGDGVDAAVARGFLDAMPPAQLAVSLATLEQVETQARQIERQWHLRLERAQYEADLARRRFLAVDPDNRLVARTLERDWNDTLAALATLEREHVAMPPWTARLVRPEERERILALAQDVPAVWAAETTSHTERKQLLRCVIKDVTVTKRPTTIAVAMRWQTAACTMGDIPRPARSCDRRRTPPAVVARVRALAPHHTDSQRTTILNHEGATPGLGGLCTASKVAWIRSVSAMPAGCPEAPGACPDGQRGDGRSAAQAAAQRLHVDVSTIAAWCRTGRLEYSQKTPHSPRWILLTPAMIAALRKPRRQRQPRRLPPA